MKTKSPIAKVLVGLISLFVCLATLIALFKRLHQAEEFAQRTTCVGNLVHLRLAKIVMMDLEGWEDGDPVDIIVLGKYLPKPVSQFRCPSGGRYLVGDFGEEPSCSHTNVCQTLYFDLNGWKIVRQSWIHSLSQ